MSHDNVVGLILYLLVAGFFLLPVLFPGRRDLSDADEPVAAPLVVRSRSIHRAAPQGTRQPV